jgi:hypothetical protein
MTERDGQIAVYNWRSHIQPWPFMLCNVYFFNWWESDVLYVTRNGYCHEFEIKVSTSDFRADAGKEHKHLVLRGEKLNRSGGIFGPALFYYVAPPGVVPLEEVPDYAGLAHIVRDRYRNLTLEIIKQAPRRQVKPITDAQWRDLGSKACGRYWSLSTHCLRDPRAIGGVDE